MAWIESHQSLLNHRKTLRLATLLKMNKYQVIGHLHALWWWGMDNLTYDGCLGDITDSEIAEASGWNQSPQAFVSGLTKAGFIDERDSVRYIHDWYDYAGKLLVRRAANRERMQQARAEHVQCTNDARAIATVPNRTQPNPTVPTDSNHKSTGNTESGGNKRVRAVSAPRPKASPDDVDDTYVLVLQAKHVSLNVAAERIRWIDYNLSVGWRTRAGPVRDFRASFRRWLDNQEDYNARRDNGATAAKLRGGQGKAASRDFDADAWGRYAAGDG